MRETTDDREFDSRFDAVFQPGFDESRAGELAEFTSVFGEVGDQGSPIEGARVPRRIVDRFLIALWVVGVALAAAGVVGFTNAMAGYARTSSALASDALMMVVYMQLSPYLFTLGMGTLIGTLFLVAVRWERRA